MHHPGWSGQAGQVDRMSADIGPYVEQCSAGLNDDTEKVSFFARKLSILTQARADIGIVPIEEHGPVPATREFVEFSRVLVWFRAHRCSRHAELFDSGLSGDV